MSALASGPGVDLVAEMLAVVAEKTGYPADMLELGMEIEADLGIDSIKRVEILSAMRERVPGLPETDPAKLAAMRTLAEIVDTLGGAGATAVSVAPAAPALASGLASGSGVDLVAEMLAVVAEKTGYPADMLELGMEIEADLGIDSIKRVEILSAMRERVPGLPETDPAKLAAMRTLAEIVDTLRGETSPVAGTPGTVATPASASTESTSGLSRFVVRARPAPAAGFCSPLFAAAAVHLIADDRGVAEALAARLEQAGVATQVIPASVGIDLFGATPTDEIEAVLDLRGLDTLDASKGVDAAVAHNHPAFDLARRLAPSFSERGGSLIFVQDTGGDFGLGGCADAPERAWLAGIAGLAKTAACEWPEADLRVIDLEIGARSPEAAAEALFDELVRGGLERELGLCADGRRLTLVTDLEAADETGAPTWPADLGSPVFVVSGGARGVTAQALIRLAQTLAASPKFLILGRTPLAPEPAGLEACTSDAELKQALLRQATAAGERPTPRALGRQVAQILAGREVRENFAALERAGAEVEYAAVDVRSAEQVAEVVAAARARWGCIDGLVHGAGVLADARLQDKLDDQFARVFETKVAGLRALLDATRDDDLRWLCLFSSVAARSGNPGQADYAMANEILNKVAHAEARRRPGCVVRSIGWGPWAGGMVTPGLAAMFEARGVGLIPLEEGCRAFVDALAPTGGISSDAVEVVIGAGLELSPGEAAGYRALVRVDRESAPELEDHRVRGEVVLPVVAVLEWFAQLARLELPEAPSWVFEDFRVLRGVVLEDYGTAPTTLELSSRAGAEGGIELALFDAQGARRHGAMLSPGRGLLHAAAELGSGAAELEPSPWSTEAVYAPGMLFHGPAFQAIAEFSGLSETGASASLRGYDDPALGLWEQRERPLDPAALDGALQLALLCGLKRFGSPSLPLSISRCEIAADPGHGPYHCELRVRGGDSQHTRCDVTLFSADGRPVVSLDGLGMFALPRVAAAE